jgi:hypothetical protein
MQIAISSATYCFFSSENVTEDSHHSSAAFINMSVVTHIFARHSAAARPERQSLSPALKQPTALAFDWAAETKTDRSFMEVAVHKNKDHVQ